MEWQRSERRVPWRGWLALALGAARSLELKAAVGRFLAVRLVVEAMVHHLPAAVKMVERPLAEAPRSVEEWDCPPVEKQAALLLLDAVVADFAGSEPVED